MSSQALMKVVPVLCSVAGFENTGTCDALPQRLTPLARPAICPVARPPLRFRRKVVKSLDALHDVAVVMTHDDVPAAFRRDLRADALADDPLMPEGVGAAVGTDSVGDHVGVEVIGVSMRSEDVLVIFHPDSGKEPFRIADDLSASRPL